MVVGLVGSRYWLGPALHCLSVVSAFYVAPPKDRPPATMRQRQGQKIATLMRMAEGERAKGRARGRESVGARKHTCPTTRDRCAPAPRTTILVSGTLLACGGAKQLATMPQTSVSAGLMYTHTQTHRHRQTQTHTHTHTHIYIPI